MEKYKVMNTEVLSDEKDQSLKEISKRLLKDITNTIEEFKIIAKQKGINYDNIVTNKSMLSKDLESSESLQNSTQHNASRLKKQDSIHSGENITAGDVNLTEPTNRNTILIEPFDSENSDLDED
jgi:hypothetical protein